MGDVATDERLVRALIRTQCPDLAQLTVRFAAEGWDNRIWRLGEDLAVRLPWATDDADALLRNEYAWLPSLAPLLPLPVTVPQRLGEPSELFPRHWLVTTWVRGTPVDREPLTRSDTADSLAGFLTALHRAAPAGAPPGRRRGGSLRAVEGAVLSGLKDAVHLVPDTDALREVWADAVEAPAWNGPPVWLHADLHPANVLAEEGRLCGVVDFGDLCAGDPACDLASTWALLPDGTAARFWSGYGGPCDDATVRRTRGWAVWRALGGVVVGEAGRLGRPGGKVTWGLPAHAALRRLAASVV